jgi:hypothetical protein
MPRLVLLALTPLLLAACAAPQPHTVPDNALSRSVAEACRAAVAERAGVPLSDVVLLDMKAGRAGIEAREIVAGAKAPWACFTDRAGAVRGVTFTGIFP